MRRRRVYDSVGSPVSLLLKGAFAVAEVLTGIGAYLVTQQFIFRLVERVTREELLGTAGRMGGE